MHVYRMPKCSWRDRRACLMSTVCLCKSIILTLFWLDSKMTHLTKCYSRIDKVLIKKIGNAHILACPYFDSQLSILLNFKCPVHLSEFNGHLSGLVQSLKVILHSLRYQKKTSNVLQNFNPNSDLSMKRREEYLGKS